jgi:3-hydroxyisobutyrate dehydrogenase-like beta-hydroxyacid dehydrogenase
VRESLGLIGIGLVGTALAENLLAAGFDVVGFARGAASRDALVRCGGRPAPSARAVGEAAERVILSLADSSAVEEVVLGPEGLLAGSARVRVILDTTTGDPERNEALAVRLAERGIHLLDGPISGSSQQIRERQGAFLIGGDRAAYEGCLDVIRAFAERHYHLGGSGAGARAKLASNLCAVDVKGQKMLQGDFTPQSNISKHHKDMRIILDCAERLGQDLPLARVHEAILARGIAAGEGDLDPSAVIRQLRALRQEVRNVQ